MSKVIFLDFDGPMLPLRSYLVDNSSFDTFDPVAVSMINKILDDDVTIKLVISSTWRSSGFEKIIKVLSKNEINSSRLHADWQTKTGYNMRRHEEVYDWVIRHLEITHWCAFDDEPSGVRTKDNWVQCSFENGISWGNYLQARELLGLKEEKFLIQQAS